VELLGMLEVGEPELRSVLPVVPAVPEAPMEVPLPVVPMSVPLPVLPVVVSVLAGGVMTVSVDEVTGGVVVVVVSVVLVSRSPQAARDRAAMRARAAAVMGVDFIRTLLAIV
jgi:hypothetical protein